MTTLRSLKLLKQAKIELHEPSVPTEKELDEALSLSNFYRPIKSNFKFHDSKEFEKSKMKFELAIEGLNIINHDDVKVKYSAPETQAKCIM